MAAILSAMMDEAERRGIRMKPWRFRADADPGTFLTNVADAALANPGEAPCPQYFFKSCSFQAI